MNHARRHRRNPFNGKNQIGLLVTAAKSEIPSAQAFLNERAEIITAMFAWVCHSGFRDENEANQRAFEQSKWIWSKYLETVPLRKGQRASGRVFMDTAKKPFREPTR